MSSDIMNSIVCLTRAGRLQDATDAIQKALSRGAPAIPAESDIPHQKAISPKPRRPLREVVAKLGKWQPKVLRNLPSPKLHVPAGAKFLEGSFSCAAGTRSYRLYVPSVVSRHRRGLVVMLHGCTQNSLDFAAGTRMNEFAETEGILVVYPDQTTAANSSACWNWFNPRDQVHGQGEPSIIAGITEEIITSYQIDPNLVFIAGLSAGGAMAVVMGHTYPDLYSAVGVHSGLPYRSAVDVISAFSAMRGERRRRNLKLQPRVIVFHGDADKTVHPSNAGAIVSSTQKHHSQTVSGVSSNGAKYTRTTVWDDNNTRLSEHWLLHDIGHAWSGGSKDGSYTECSGPDASKEMVAFFMKRPSSTIEH